MADTPNMHIFAPLAHPPFSDQYATELTEGLPLPLFPMLMPEGWQHAPTQLRTSLYAKTRLRGIPDIALVHLVPTPNNGMPNIAWVRSERSDQLGATFDDFKRVAFANVAQRQLGLRLDVLPDGRPWALCDGDYLAAERILDPAFLDKLHALLSSDALIVGVPERGTLLAAPYGDVVFAQMIAAAFANARNKPISPVPFRVERGVITAALELA